MPLEIGDPIPELTLQRADGTSVALREMADSPLVLIFLRHLA